MSTKHDCLSHQVIRRLQGYGLLLNGYDIDEVVEITAASLSSVNVQRINK